MTVPRVLNRYTLTEGQEGVYIGRPSKWQNPFPVTEALPRKKCVEKYNAWLLTQPELMEEARRELKGKNLICFCAPRLCHGDTLFALANAPFEGPVPFEHYRIGEPVSSYGYYLTRVEDLQLSAFENAPVNEAVLLLDELSDEAHPPLVVYRVDFTVLSPTVVTGPRKGEDHVFCTKALARHTKTHDCVVFTPAELAAEGCQLALLRPKHQITAITRVQL